MKRKRKIGRLIRDELITRKFYMYSSVSLYSVLTHIREHTVQSVASREGVTGERPPPPRKPKIFSKGRQLPLSLRAVSRENLYFRRVTYKFS